MGRIFSTGSIPKNIPAWEYNAFRQLAISSGAANAGVAAIARGESPDGSGSPLVDLSTYFLLPGRVGGQTGYGSTQPSGTLTLSSTIDSTKGKIYLGSSRTQAAFDEVNGRLGVGTINPTGNIHGVALTGGGSTLLPNSDINTNFNRYTGAGGTPDAGARYAAINTIDDDTSYLATNASVGVNPQICGLSGTATVGYSGWRVTYRIRTFSGSPLSGSSVIRFRIVLNNGRYYDSASVNVSSLGSSWATSTVDIDTTGAGTLAGTANSVELYLPGTATYCLITYVALTPITTASVAAEAGTFQGAGAFGESVFSIRGTAYANVIMKVFDDGRTFFEDQAGNGIYLLGTTDTLTIYAKSTALKLLSAGTATSWSDSVSSHFLYLGDLIGGTARRGLLSSTNTAPLDRLGISSTYTLITDAAANAAGFLSGTGSPLLRVSNTVTAADVVMEIRGMSGQTGNLLEFSQNGTRGSYIDKYTHPFIQQAAGATTPAFSVTTEAVPTIGIYQFVVYDVDGVTPIFYVDAGAGGIAAGGNLAATQSFTIYDPVGGGSAAISASAAGNNTYTIPDVGSGSDFVLTSGTQTLAAKTLSTSCLLTCTSASTGASFRDSTTIGKRLRMVLSGAASGNNSFTLTNTGARNFGFGNLSGNVIVVGDDPPSVASGALGKVDLTGQTAAIASTNLSNTPPTGFYHVEVVAVCTTASGSGAPTLDVTLAWTDVLGATTENTINALALSATGRAHGATRMQVASGNIAYSTTINAASGSPQYAIYIRVIALG